MKAERKRNKGETRKEKLQEQSKEQKQEQEGDNIDKHKTQHSVTPFLRKNVIPNFECKTRNLGPYDKAPGTATIAIF